MAVAGQKRPIGEVADEVCCSAKAVSGWQLRTSKLQVRLHTSRNYGYRDGFDGRHEMALM